MSAFVRFMVALVVVCLGFSLRGWSQEDIQQQYSAVRTQNCLVCAGHLPFHIKITAQLYSLEGDAAGTGTVEEWWASPGRYRIETSGPDGQQVQTSDAASTLPPVRRSNYLLRLLLDQSVNPIPPLGPESTVQITEHTFGTETFRCFAVGRKANPTDTMASPTYCTEPGKMELRVANPSSLEGGVRNKIARFHDTFVAFQTGIRFGDHQAVTGEVQALKALDPEASPYPELHSTPAQGAADKREGTESAGVVPGKPISQSLPKYPVEMRSALAQGRVVLGIVISREGHVASAATLASPSPALSRAAEEAVRTWTFSPATLGGKPIELPTEVIVNFAGFR